MRSYVIAVRRWWTVPLAVAVLVLVCGSVGSSEIPVPSLVGGMVGARLAYFTPVLIVLAVMYCLERRLCEAESTAVTPVRRYDNGALILTVMLTHSAGLVVGMDVARNVTLLLAVALITRRLANEATAAGAGLLLLILNLVLGRAYQPDGHPSHAWWALPLYPAGNLAAWLIAVGLFAIALTLPLPQAGRSD